MSITAEDIRQLQGDVDHYQAKHGQSEKETVEVLTADIPDEGYYQDRIKSLTIENAALRKENDSLKKELDNRKYIIERNEKNNSDARLLKETELLCKIADRDERISKLERALLDSELRNIK